MDVEGRTTPREHLDHEVNKLEEDWKKKRILRRGGKKRLVQKRRKRRRNISASLTCLRGIKENLRTRVLQFDSVFMN